MRIYVASSWRNAHQPNVVAALRGRGHEVYDFREGEDAFSWREIDERWAEWNASVYIRMLSHQASERGFKRDMDALEACDLCIYVMPCGPSASMEAGWAKGAGKPVVAYVPAIREPDLMIKMFDVITDRFSDVMKFVEEANDRLRGSTDLSRDGAALPASGSLRA